MKLKLVRSPIGRKPQQVATLKALGLKKIGDEKEVSADNPAVRGMVERVRFMLQVTDSGVSE